MLSQPIAPPPLSAEPPDPAPGSVGGGVVGALTVMVSDCDEVPPLPVQASV